VHPQPLHLRAMEISVFEPFLWVRTRLVSWRVALSPAPPGFRHVFLCGRNSLHFLYPFFFDFSPEWKVDLAGPLTQPTLLDFFFPSRSFPTLFFVISDASLVFLRSF